MDQLKNVIPFKIKEKSLSLNNNDITSLFLGLVKIIQNEASCNKEKSYLDIICKQELEIKKLKIKLKNLQLLTCSDGGIVQKVTYENFKNNSKKLINKIKQN